MKTPKKPVPVKKTMSNGILFEATCGNKKLPTSTMIINMGSATDCPSDKLGLCSMGRINGDGSCYALKAEIQYPDCRPYRNRQEIMWKKSSARVLTETILKVLKTRPYITAIRFNESGDFHSTNCINKLSEIASQIPIPVYAYTHRYDIFTEDVTKNLNQNLTINFSTEMGFNHNHNEFRLTTDVKDTVDSIPCISDCSVCSMCVHRNSAVMTIDKH